MKWSKLMFSSVMTALNDALFSSASAWGVTPFAAADCSTFSPCSSVPVRKNVSRPLLRLNRAYTSATVLVYACLRSSDAGLVSA